MSTPRNMNGHTAVAALPTIVRYLGITDGGEPNSEICPHCGAKGRIVHHFEVETDNGRERRGAMSGCVQLFPMSYLARKRMALAEKEREHARKGWTLNRSEQAMVEIIDAYDRDEIDREHAERQVMRLADSLAAWRQNRYGKRGRR